MILGLFFFFFQAEDGIRDLVRSRGLGDVYKRQPYDSGISLVAQISTAISQPGGLTLYYQKQAGAGKGIAICVICQQGYICLL